MNSYQDMIPSLASSWLVAEKCEVCQCDYVADGNGICEGCSERLTQVFDEEAGRVTVQIAVLDTPFYDEAIELTADDIVEEVAA